MKTLTKIEKRILDLFDTEAKNVKSNISEFYPNGTLANFATVDDMNPLINAIEKYKLSEDSKRFTDDQLFNKCDSIRKKIKSDISIDCTEINFQKGIQRTHSTDYPLGYMIVKLLLRGTQEPIYLYLDKDDKLDSIVFLGGDDADCILVMKDNSGEYLYACIAELNCISISENSNENFEVGLVTSYSWFFGRVFYGVISGPNLDPIKNLLLCDAMKKMKNRITLEEVKSNEQKD